MADDKLPNGCTVDGANDCGANGRTVERALRSSDQHANGTDRDAVICANCTDHKAIVCTNDQLTNECAVRDADACAEPRTLARSGNNCADALRGGRCRRYDQRRGTLARHDSRDYPLLYVLALDACFDRNLPVLALVRDFHQPTAPSVEAGRSWQRRRDIAN